MTPSLTNHTLLAPDGQPVGIVVPVEEWDRLRAENERLRAEVVAVRRQRDTYMEEIGRWMKETIPIPCTKEQMDPALANPEALDAILARLDLPGRAS